MMFKPIGMMIPLIRMASQLKDSEKVQDIKDAIDERDKEKVNIMERHRTILWRSYQSKSFRIYTSGIYISKNGSHSFCK